MTTREPMKTTTEAKMILKQARDYIAQPYCWTRGDNVRTVRRGGKEFTAYCALGAIEHVQPGGPRYYAAALATLRSCIPDGERYGIIAFNDRSTKRQVLAAFDRAIEKASR